MTTLNPHLMFRVELLHYIPIQGLGWNDCTPFLYNVQGRMTAVHPYTMFSLEWLKSNPYLMFRVEWLLSNPVQCLG